MLWLEGGILRFRMGWLLEWGDWGGGEGLEERRGGIRKFWWRRIIVEWE